MFVILNITESGKKRIRKGQSVSGVREISVHAGERFYVVDVFDSNNGVNWLDVSAFIGKHRNRVLMDRRFEFPEYAPLCRFEPIRFKNLLLFNTAEMILKELFLSGMRIRCIINDPKGEYCAYLRQMAKFAAQTAVRTSNEFRYFSEIQSIYHQYGAGITLSSSVSASGASDFLIDTADCSFSVGRYKFTPSIVDGFNSLRVLCPAYIDILDFFGAFFELNKHDALSSAICSGMQCSNARMSVSEIIELIKSVEKRKNIIFYV